MNAPLQGSRGDKRGLPSTGKEGGKGDHYATNPCKTQGKGRSKGGGGNGGGGKGGGKGGDKGGGKGGNDRLFSGNLFNPCDDGVTGDGRNELVNSSVYRGNYNPTFQQIGISTAARNANPTPRPSNSGGDGLMPSDIPTSRPSNGPTVSPTDEPTQNPNRFITNVPTVNELFDSVNRSTKLPTAYPTNVPTSPPISKPTTPPFVDPIEQPSNVPVHIVTQILTRSPFEPTRDSVTLPTGIPTNRPTAMPTRDSALTPPISTSRSKGNVLRSLYEQWNDEGVVSEQVLEALTKDTGNSEECDDWIHGMDGESLTPRQTMNVECQRIAYAP